MMSLQSGSHYEFENFDMPMRMNKIIQIHIGHAGIEIANPCWELYCLEHNIQLDGTTTTEPNIEFGNVFYECSETGKVTADSIIIDTEPSAVDDIRLGPYRKLFDINNIICGKYDCGNIYTRGYYDNSKLLIDQITDVINGLAEKYDYSDGFLIFRSLGGGTGSGLGAQIMEHLDYCFPKKLKYEFVIFPSPSFSPVIVEPYNAILSTHATMELSDCTISLDNDSVHEICLNNLDIEGPNYRNLNDIIGQVISTFTSTFRLKGVCNSKYNDINNILVPYPLLHFPIISYAPNYSSKKNNIENLSCLNLTNLLFETKNQLIKFNQLNNKYFSTIFLYRGNFNITNINDTINDIKTKSDNFMYIKNINFGLNNMLPTHPSKCPLIQTANDVCLLGNNSGIQESWIPIINKFNIMFKKKAFLYHFLTEGLNELDFEEAKQDICSLMDEYKALEDKSVEFLRPDSVVYG